MRCLRYDSCVWYAFTAFKIERRSKVLVASDILIDIGEKAISLNLPRVSKLTEQIGRNVSVIFIQPHFTNNFYTYHTEPTLSI